MESERKRSDEYWMGVRDALRMIDSFNKWARRNKERAKDLDDFIHDGLIAAAKRCESCLKDDLGLTFVEGEDIGADEPVPSGYEASQPPSEEVSFEVSEDDITIESVGRSGEDEIEDISLDGPSREFSSDFELIEPSPLVVEPSSIDDDDEISSPEEESEVKPSFTWADYEKAVTPKKEESVIDEDEEEIEAEEEYDLDDEIEATFELSEDESIPFDEDISLGPPKVLAPSEEPALPTDELESSYDEEIPPPADLEDLGDADMSGPITEPPPPPPPPESEEDEDERRRRARRLFFGD